MYNFPGESRKSQRVCVDHRIANAIYLSINLSIYLSVIIIIMFVEASL